MADLDAKDKLDDQTATDQSREGSSLDLPNLSTAKAIAGKGGVAGLAMALSKRKKKLALFGGGGIALTIFSVAIFSFIQAHAMTGMMDGIEKWAKKRLYHTITSRENLYKNQMIARLMGVGDEEIFDNQDQDFYKRVLRALDKNERFKSSLRKEIEASYRANGIRKISTTTTAGGRPNRLIIEYSDGRPNQTYDLNSGRTGAARAALLADLRPEQTIHPSASKTTQTRNAFKRLREKRLITKLTGTKWHFLDPIKEPYKQVRAKVRSSFIDIAVRSKALRGFFVIMANKLGLEIGEEAFDAVGKELSLKAANEAGEKVTKEVAVKALQQIAPKLNPIGAIILAVEFVCLMDKFFDDGDIREPIAEAVSNFYMESAYNWDSRAAQQREGSTNAEVVHAHNEMLVSADGKYGISASNNFRRVFEPQNAPAYQESYDCEDGREMCLGLQPEHILDRNAVGKTFNWALELGKAAYNPGEQNFIVEAVVGDRAASVIAWAGKFASVPLDLACGVFLKGTQILGGILGWVFDRAADLAKLAPPTRVAVESLQNVSSKVMQWGIQNVASAAVSMLGIDELRGPQLFNMISAGYEIGADKVFEEEFQAPEIPPEQVTVMNHEADKMLAAERQAQPLWSRIASSSDPHSILNRLALSVPPTPKAAFQATGSQLASIFNFSLFTKNLALAGKGTFIAPAYAADPYVSPFGKSKFHGFTPTDLALPLGDPKMAAADRSVGCSMMGGAIAAGLVDPTDYPEECAEDDADTLATGGPGTGAGSGSGSNPNLTLPTGTASELAQQIRANSNIKVTKSLNNVHRDLLAMIVALGQDHKFTITSLRRPGTGSKHNRGVAMDIQFVNGKGPSSDNYSDYSPEVQNFLNAAASLMPPGNCEFGLPNQKYIGATKPKVDASCDVFFDKGTGAHIHIGLPE